MANNFIILPYDANDDLEVIKYHFVSNLNFQTPWLKLANALGFNAFLPHSNNITIVDSKYIIHEQKTLDENSFQIIVSDIDFEFLPETISLQEQIVENLTPSELSTLTVNNSSNSYINTTKTFDVTKQKSTSVSSSHKISNSLSVKQSFSASVFLVTASLDINYKFSYQYSFGNQKTAIESTKVSELLNLSIPPKTSIPIKIMSHKVKTTTPFTALVKINYKLTFKGPFNINNSYNKKVSKPNLPGPAMLLFSYTFGTDKLSANEDIHKQYMQSSIPESSEWDWSLLGRQTSTDIRLGFFPSLFLDFATQINGKFEQEDSTIISAEISKNIPL